MDDREIVGLFLARDEKAIEASSEKFGKSLRAIAFGITKDEQSAEECENDTYYEAWKSIPPHEPKSYLFAFLARITRNFALNLCRRNKRLCRSAFICELTSEMEQCIPGADDIACRIDEIAFGEAINGFLEKIGAEKRNIFIRRYWYLDSVSEIAKRFSLSESKVKTTLFRCRKKLREYLEKEGYTL